MLLRIVLSVLCLSVFARAQADIWKQVNTSPDARPVRVSVSKLQLDAIKKVIVAEGGAGRWPCTSAADDWTKSLIFEDLPVSHSQKALLVEAGPGCARGGQGANGAMWVVHFEADKAILLASPTHQFNGWLYSIQPTGSHGLNDIVLGWHMGATETGLSYFRFNGNFYRRVGTASLTADADGSARITAEPNTH
jgi:hypothetical protein